MNRSHAALECGVLAGLIFLILAGPSWSARVERTIAEEHSLYAKALALKQQHRDGPARKLFVRLLAIREMKYGLQSAPVAEILRHIGTLDLLRGAYADAESNLKRAIEMLKTLQTKPPDVLADSLHNLGTLYGLQGKFDSAREAYLEEYRLRETYYGPQHPNTAKALESLGWLYSNTSDYAKGERYYKQALQVREQSLGPKHPEVARSLLYLGECVQEEGKFAEAKDLILRAVRIRESHYGAEHAEVAHALSFLGHALRELGEYTNSISIYQRVLRIYTKTVGHVHPRVAETLNDLAWAHRELGHYEQAVPLLQKALSISETTMGPDALYVATCHSDLASLCGNRGDYPCAEEHYRRALAIRESQLGPKNRYVADTLFELAQIYEQQGAYDKSESLLNQALAIRESILGAQHAEVGTALNRLAMHYRARSEYAKALRLQERALAVFELSLGSEHLLVADALHNLGMLQVSLGNLARAETLLLQAKRLREKGLGTDHPEVASIRVELGGLAALAGRYEEAQLTITEALRLQERVIGPNHPDFAETLRQAAVVMAVRGDTTTAVTHLNRAVVLTEGRLRREALSFSESRLLSFLSKLHAQEEQIYSLLQTSPKNPELLHLALATSLLRKGRSVDLTARTSQAIYSSLSEADRTRFNELRAIRSRVADLSYASAEGRRRADAHQPLLQLEERAEALESVLASRSAALLAHTQAPGPAEIVAEVTRSLPPDGALIEVVTALKPPLMKGMAGAGPHSASYIALVLHADGAIAAVDLGNVDTIDATIAQFLAEASQPGSSFLPGAQLLYRQVFQKLSGLLVGRRKIYLSLDGQLSMVPFAALHDGDSYLIDKFDLSYLTSGRDLLRTLGTTPARSGPVILADPTFSVPPPLHESSTMAPLVRALRGVDFAELPGTRKEAEAIAQLLPHPTLVTGTAATSAALLGVNAPSVLHVATHGLFLRDETASGQGTRGFDTSHRHTPSNPLLRSALVLAGALPRTGAETNAAAPSSTNGRVYGLATALEIAGMNLWGTQLVVLSACETGRGDVRLGQGVFGLRRSVMVAGAETIVTSLWKVDDATTTELMVAFYRNLVAGARRSEAMRLAALDIRKKFPHPFYWASFIVIGQTDSVHHLDSGLQAQKLSVH